MTRLGFEDARIARWMVWSGPACCVLGAVGMIMARIVPPPSPAKSGAEIAAMFVDHQVAIRIGLLICLVGFTFWGMWAASVLAMTRRMESGFPVLTYGSMMLVILGASFFLYPLFFWAAAAFRPEAIPADMTRLLNDVAWIAFVFPGFPFCLWFGLLGVAILNDKNATPIFPRWIAWTCFLLVFCIAPAGLIIFFKDGPFAWNGVIGFWELLATFFAWMCLFTVYMFKAISHDEKMLQREPVAAPLAMTTSPSVATYG